MPFIKTNAYNDDERRAMRLNACKQCIFVACNGNSMNNCDTSKLTCTIDNQNVIVKTSDLNETCPMNYWVESDKMLSDYMPGPGCGCHK